MRELSDVRLVEMLPAILATDPFVSALSEAFDHEFHLLVQDTDRIAIFLELARGEAGITPGPSDNLLDHLAWQFGVDFYDQSMTIPVKCALISKAIYWARVKGTPNAIERVIAIAFGEGRVQEWFEYQGQPFHFRVRATGGRFPDSAKFDLLMRMIRIVKRATAILESLTIEQSAQLPLSFGGAIQIGEKITIGSA